MLISIALMLGSRLVYTPVSKAIPSLGVDQNSLESLRFAV